MYLKEESFYSNLYDLMTVKECLMFKDIWNGRLKVMKDVDKAKLDRWAVDFQLNFIKGERYRKRSAVLKELMDEDKKRDHRLESAVWQKKVVCSGCQGFMNAMFKDLYSDSLRVLFIFECPKCGKRKGIFDDGEEFVSKGAKLTKAEIADWDREDAERSIRNKEDMKLLELYRSEFCLSEAEGEEYILSSTRVQELSDYLKAMDQKLADPDYHKVKQIRMLKIAELEKYLREALGKESYIKLELGSPIIDRHIVVNMAVQDEDSSRKEHDSIHKLQKLLKKQLANTNWRLMSEGASYRLGYLSCRLKGYEEEDDLLQIVKI